MEIKDQVIEGIAVKSSYGASAVTIISGLTINEWGVICGVIVGVISLLTTIYYKHKHLQIVKNKK